MYDLCFFFFNDTATTEIYTLSLHDALPICPLSGHRRRASDLLLAPLHPQLGQRERGPARRSRVRLHGGPAARQADRKSTRLNSSHANISYAVFCLKKKKK